jgi:hypothetical protein
MVDVLVFVGMLLFFDVPVFFFIYMFAPWLMLISRLIIIMPGPLSLYAFGSALFVIYGPFGLVGTFMFSLR